MDEPTATTDPEIDELFELIEQLKSDGIAIFYISHRLEEVVRIADRVTVMRDGQVVKTLGKGEFDESRAGQADGRYARSTRCTPSTTPRSETSSSG